MLRKRAYVGFVAIIFGVLLLFCIVLSGQQAFAMSAENSSIESKQDVNPEIEVEPRLFTTLTLSIGGENGEIWAEVRNDFTLGFATVLVYVELYSSATYQESYTNMRLENRNFIADLDIFQTVGVSAPTGGVQRYWMARMRYRVNSSDWEEKTSNAWLFDADGNVLNQ